MNTYNENQKDLFIEKIKEILKSKYPDYEKWTHIIIDKELNIEKNDYFNATTNPFVYAKSTVRLMGALGYNLEVSKVKSLTFVKKINNN